MGSCQSTPAASGGPIPTNMPTKVTGSESHPAGGIAPPQSASANQKSMVAPSASTDPADVSHHSLSLDEDASVKSFASTKSQTKPTTTSSSYDVAIDGASICSSGSGNKKNPRHLRHSSSALGLDELHTETEGAGLTAKLVHIEVPFGKPIEEVYDGVHTGPVLGSGISGLVRLVSHKATGVKYAVKCLDLGLVDTDEGLAQLREEIFIMCQLDHPNIVRLEEVYESHTEIYLVQELCLGGELFDRLDEQPDYHYTEAECARLVKQMLCAVRYLHSKGIIHRDLKLENFLFSSTATDSELKMIDFGLSKHFRYGEVQHEAVGTPYTVAPEVIKGSYDERCDIWAIGVIAFLLLSGEPPFGGCGGPEPLMTVRSNILKGKFDFEPEDIWESVSDGAREFIRNMLVVDPKYRPTAFDAQNQPWLLDWSTKNRTEADNVLNPNVVKALVNFKEFSDMRKLLCEVLSFTLLPEQIKDLRKEFEKMDTDGSGEISLSALKQVLVTNAGAGSLGALTEDEVEDIFNAMRVKKTETRIHWHEFIAAGLSQCQVDDRNLRLAFDRLDSDHKGFVTLDDIVHLLGSDNMQDELMLRKMWGDSMKAVNNTNHSRITYGDFLLLMKGQTRETGDLEEAKRADGMGLSLAPAFDMLGSASQLITVPEEPVEEAKALTDGLMNGTVLTPKKNGILTRGGSMPLTPIMSVSDPDVMDTPLSMDEDDDIQPSTSVFRGSSLTPPTTPRRSATDYVSPRRAVDDTVFLSKPLSIPPMPNIDRPRSYIRKRSASMDEKDAANTDDESASEDAPKFFTPDARRAVLLPEHDPTQKGVYVNQNKTALQVNRQLYRAHRTMRLSVLEASRKFEEQQARHARDMLLAQQAEEKANKVQAAGLVMRRVQDKTITTEAVRQVLEDSKKEQQSLMQEANKRCGRGRGRRKKTVSDIGGMMGSLTQNEMQKISQEAQGPEPIPVEPTIPTVIETDLNDPIDLRGATVPGEFRKVNDPFGRRGKYGGILQ